MSIVQSVKRNVQIRGDETATLFGDRRHSWRALCDRAARLAGGLQALGIATGDRVAILALNSDRYLEYCIAVPWAGAVVVPLNIRWSAAEIAYALNDSGTVGLFIDDAFARHIPALRDEVGSLRSIVFMGDGPAPAGSVGFEALVEAGPAVPDSGRLGEDLAGVFYTGGTTGFPKGVMLPHRGLWASAMAYLAVADRSAEPRVLLHAAPMFHLADVALTMGGMLSGDAHAVVPFFSPENVLDAVERFRITDTLLVPTMINMLISHPKIAEADVSSIRFMAYGGSVIPEAVLRRAIAALPNCRFMQAYGQTELSPVATLLGPEYHVLEGPNAGRLTSAGRPAACNELEIVDVNDVEVPRGTVGEIRCRGANTMLGYWNKPHETAAAFRDGWVYTGDAAYMDEEGFVYIVDRLKDMIVSGGENVFSAEVENVVCNHPAVGQCAVIAVPSVEWGEAVHALVILREGCDATAADIIAHCRQSIAGYKCPRSVEFRIEAFPLSGAGKVLKRELRRPYWEEAERQVS
jgi:acyl-CoA synthetase (AMP-forming)/AMP-acid ligase II